MRVKEELKDYEEVINQLIKENVFDTQYGGVVKQQLSWYVKESKKARQKYNILNTLIAITGSSIPVINIMGISNVRLITTFLSVTTGVLMYILKLRCYRTSWKNYRGSAEKIKALLRRSITLDKTKEIKIEIMEVKEERVDITKYFSNRYEEIVYEEVGLWGEWLTKKHEVER